MKRFLYGTAGLAFASLGVFFLGITLYVARSEVWPAIQRGSLNVDTNSMILNILWEGNEIYVLLLGYLLLGTAFAFGAVRAFSAAIRRR